MQALCDYMSSTEKYFAMIESVSKAKMLRLNYEFDKLMMEHDELVSQIDEKIMCERGTEDDMVSLYTVEAEEVKEKGKGIISKIISAIAGVFKKIKEFLFGKKDAELPQEVTLPENPDQLVKEGNGIIASIRSFLSGNKDSLKNSALTGAVSAATNVLTHKAIKELEEFVNDCEKKMKQMDDAAKKKDMSPEEQGLFRKALNKLSSISTRCQKCISSIFKKDKTSDDNTKTDEDDTNISSSDGAGVLKDKIKKFDDKIVDIKGRLALLVNSDEDAIKNKSKISDYKKAIKKLEAAREEYIKKLNDAK